MPLNNIAIMPRAFGDQGAALPWLSAQPAFDFSHYQDHVEIAQAIKAKTGIAVNVYPLFGGPPDSDQWQRMHQQMHIDMNTALQLPQGRDFTNGELDQTWYNANFMEHQAARAKLGI